MNPTGWTAAAIRLMALWLVVGVLIGVPGFFANWYARAVGVAIQIVAGLGLILGSKGISGVIEKVRSPRRDVEPNDVEEE